jgi:hypothetical protein
MYEQNSIVFEWFNYSSYQKKSKSKLNHYCLPFLDDSTEDVPRVVHTHVLCSRELLLVLAWELKRWATIWNATNVTGVVPMHKAFSKQNYNSNLTNKSML